MKRLASALTGTRRITHYMPPQAAPLAEPLPIYAGTFEADVLIPTAQASKLAGAFALPVAVGGLLAWGLEDWPWWTAPTACAAVYALAYAWATTRFIAHSRQRIETWQPNPAPKGETTVLEVVSPDGKQRRNVHLDVEPHTLAKFAQDAPRKGLAIGTWTGGGKPFSRRGYEAFTTRLMRAGLVGWKDPRNKNLGLAFTDEGLGVMDKLAAGEATAPHRGGYNILDGGPLLEE